MQEMSLFDRLFSLPWWWLLLWCIALIDVGFVLGWLGKCMQLNRKHRRLTFFLFVQIWRCTFAAECQKRQSGKAALAEML